MQYIFNVVILGAVYAIFFHKRWKKLDRDASLIYHLIYIYLTLVLFVTLMPFRIPIPGITGTNNLFWKSINWVPFIDLIEHNGNAFRGIFLNVVMLIPFGFLLPRIKEHTGFQIAIFGFLFSLSIETMQLLYVWAGGIENRSFDVTDLITNTFGALVGYLSHLALFWSQKGFYNQSEE